MNQALGKMFACAGARKKSAVISFLAFALCLITLAFAVQYFHRAIVLKTKVSLSEPAENLIPDARFVRFFSLGADQLLADLWWLAFVQYLGDGKARAGDHFVLCYPYLKLITELDPHFVEPYWFAAFACGSDQGRPDLASQILEYGIKENPDNWYLPWIAGINQYLFAHNDKQAARFYRMAAKFPHAPDWVSRQAAVLESNIPQIVKRIRTLVLIYLSAKDPLVMASARKQLVDLWLAIYEQAPTKLARDGARTQLENLGVKVK